MTSTLSVVNDCCANVPEVWGGAEYTYNRVRDRYFDQMVFSGHADRLSDYDHIVKLGIKSLRFGMVWERHELDPSWKWSDTRLNRLRELNMRPIASLLHHGSGPSHTSLVDPEFPEKFSRYATKVGQRYPWIDAYTVINEPHTTARFSGLYGIWYPHARSRAKYLRALLNQLKATVLSMKAIRQENPSAQLIQTDDLGRITGTEELRDTWELLNERRWLPYDLLFGRVDQKHPLFDYIRRAGISEREILWFAEHPCPPNVIGINYYLSSDRYMDHRVDLYPERYIARDRKSADVELVSVEGCEISGFGSILAEGWHRYRTPLAITEVHLGDDPEQQIRWLAEAWQDAKKLRQKGVDVRAITIWALLGSFYWNKLVVSENGHYEPGAFDVRSGTPVPTALADAVAQIARGQDPEHPCLKEQGWWRSPNRNFFSSLPESSRVAA